MNRLFFISYRAYLRGLLRELEHGQRHLRGYTGVAGHLRQYAQLCDGVWLAIGRERAPLPVILLPGINVTPDTSYCLSETTITESTILCTYIYCKLEAALTPYRQNEMSLI